MPSSERPRVIYARTPLRGKRINLRVSILASGSSGNCTLLETLQTRLLVDAGLSKRETLRRLTAIREACESSSAPPSGETSSFAWTLDRLDGILISHEHSDHIGGLAPLAAKWHSTVYLTQATHAETVRLLPETQVKRLQRVEFIEAGQTFSIGDIEVTPFAIPHDAVDPIGFVFRAGGVKAVVVTDLGYMPELVKHYLRGADALVLESNHDLEMLKVGPYPWHIKQRVMSRTGHLSNHTVSEFLSDPDGFDACSRYVVLAHLSENNNNPDVARISAEEALGRRPSHCAFHGELLVAAQRAPLPPLQL